jgi:hypothetical protein
VPGHQVNRDGSEGGPSPWYELVRSVAEGDVTYHYNEREQRFVGRSLDGGPEDDTVDPGMPRRSFLHPFKAKADSSYVTEVVRGRGVRARRYERPINDCAEWLQAQGYEPMRNAAVDLGLEEPLVIIEGKTIGSQWAPPFRQVVSLIYEYRYFKVAAPNASLIFLSQEQVPAVWLHFLEKDSRNRCHVADEVELSPLTRARIALEF